MKITPFYANFKTNCFKAPRSQQSLNQSKVSQKNNEIQSFYYTPLNFKGELNKELVYQFMDDVEINGKMKKRLKPEVKEFFDNQTVTYKDSEGIEKEGSIKDALKSLILQRRDLDEWRMYHGTTQKSIENILQNGPDMLECKEGAFGPGMYFAFSEGDAMVYSPAKITADIKGVERENGEKGQKAIFNELFDKKFDTQKVTKTFEDEFGKKARFGFFTAKTVFEEYCRQIFTDELNIDAAYGHARCYQGVLVVFNPNSITNISKF